MDTVGAVITSLTKEEVRFFKLYQSRMNTGERKDLLLFDRIRKQGEAYDEEPVFRKLYGDGDKNAFYRLRNRLLTDINKCLLMQHFDEEETLATLNLFALSRLYNSKKRFDLASGFLRKAETRAAKGEHYELLDLIYSEFIRLSPDLMEVNPETYISKRRENRERIQQLRSIEDVVAVLSYRLKITQNFAKGDQSVLNLLQKTVETFLHDHSVKKSPKFLFRIYSAVSQILLQKRDYPALEEYLMKTYREFMKAELFNRGNHDVRLQMLTYLVNSLFKNDKLKQSLQYTGELLRAMEEFERLHYDKYLFFYYNSLVINYSRLDKEKAISVLNDMLANEKITGTAFYEIFIYLNLAVLHFDTGRFRDAIRYLTRLYQLDSYRNADRALQMKIAVMELMVRFELKDSEYVVYRVNRIRKEFRDLLRSEEFLKEKEFLGLILQLDTSRQHPAFQKKISQFIDNYQFSSDSDDEILNYAAWLKEKNKRKRSI